MRPGLRRQAYPIEKGCGNGNDESLVRTVFTRSSNGRSVHGVTLTQEASTALAAFEYFLYGSIHSDRVREQSPRRVWAVPGWHNDCRRGPLPNR